MTPQRSDSEQPRTAAEKVAADLAVKTTLTFARWMGWLQEAEGAGYRLVPIEAEAGSASPSEPLREALGKWVTAGFSNEAVDQRLYHADAVYKAIVYAFRRAVLTGSCDDQAVAFRNTASPLAAAQERPADAELLTSILVDAENDDQMGVEYQPEALAEYIAARIAVPPAVTLLRQISLAPAGYLADGTSVREAASRFLAAQPSPEPAEPEGTQR
jgi:hypothetical protein